jgi:group I intron endonuclease
MTSSVFPNATERPGVYLIRNQVTGKVYVGSATNILTRWWLHLRQLRKGTHHSPMLQHSFAKHGEGAFSWEVLDLIEDRDARLERENEFIAYFNSANRSFGYNVVPYAESVEGLKRGPMSEETKRKLSLSKLGRTWSPEQHAAFARTMATKDKSYYRSPEYRAKISAALRGRTFTAEHKAALSAARRAAQ